MYKMSEKKGLRALEEWCRKVTEGYKDVEIKNMSTSWKDGLAFCAIIHHFRPDLLDFNSLSKNDVLHNNSLAFSILEKQLGVPALLDAEDMVNYEVPDRLSIATYVSQLYQHFEIGANKKFGLPRRAQKHSFGTQNTETEACKKIRSVDATKLSGKKYETCQICKCRVFILERLMVSGKLYHRTCFKCYRCEALLKPGAYSESEIPGVYECTVCPRDEENDFKMDCSANDTSITKVEETIVNFDSNKSEKFQFQKDPEISDSFSEARKKFLHNSLQQSDNKSKHDKLKDDSNAETDNKNIAKSNINHITVKSSLKKSFVENLVSEYESQTKMHEQVSENKILTKPLIARKPELPYFSKFSNSKLDDSKIYNVKKIDNLSSDTNSDENDQHSVDLKETSETSLQEKYCSPFAKNELKSFDHSTPHDSLKLNSSISENNQENKDTLNHSKNIDRTLVTNKSNVPFNRGTSLDLPVIKSSFQTPFITKNLTRAKSDNNFQKTQKLSILSEALLFPTRGKTDANDLQSVLHSKWSKQSNYSLPMVKTHERFSSLSDLKCDTLKKSCSVDESVVAAQTEDVSSGANFSSVADLKYNISNKMDNTEVSNTKMHDPSITENINESSLRTDVTDSILNNSVFGMEKQEKTNEKNLDNLRYEISDNLQFESYSNSNIIDKKINLSKSTDKVNLIEEDMKAISEEREDQKEENIPEIKYLKKSKSEETFLSVCSEKSGSDTLSLNYPVDLNPFGDDDISEEETTENEEYPDTLNPFDSTEDEEEEETNSSINKAHTLQMGSLKTEYDQSLNPFASDDDEDDANDKIDLHPKSSLDPQLSHNYSSLNDLSYTKKKKRPPPPPPSPSASRSPSNTKNESHVSGKFIPTPVKGQNLSRSSPRLSQKKAAPKPPVINQNGVNNLNKTNSDQKENNENIKSNVPVSYPTKQWKKKKRPAPSVPVPPRRQVKMIPLKEIQSEMINIEEKQQELENQGRELEVLIRNHDPDTEQTVEEEEAIMQLFELVNQKNALFRRQAELMYIKRSQRLEEEQVEIEYQIRCLMNKPATKRTEEDAQKEEELLQRLLDVVEQRNEIVDTIEMDRKSREAQEDQSIQEQMEQKNMEIKEKWKGTLMIKKKEKHKDKTKGKKKKHSKEEKHKKKN